MSKSIHCIQGIKVSDKIVMVKLVKDSGRQASTSPNPNPTVALCPDHSSTLTLTIWLGLG